MNFKSMCESYIEMNESNDQAKVRRKIWPPNMHLLLGLGVDAGGTPLAVVRSDAGGVRSPELLTFGMSLFMNGEMVVFGWCPPIEDVMGQDWEFIKGG
jgi:hypothetical protein